MHDPFYELYDAHDVVHITTRRVAFAVWDAEHKGFGQILVELEPGESTTFTISGRDITVIRDYVN